MPTPITATPEVLARLAIICRIYNLGKHFEDQIDVNRFYFTAPEVNANTSVVKNTVIHAYSKSISDRVGARVIYYNRVNLASLVKTPLITKGSSARVNDILYLLNTHFGAPFNTNDFADITLPAQGVFSVNALGDSIYFTGTLSMRLKVGSPAAIAAYNASLAPVANFTTYGNAFGDYPFTAAFADTSTNTPAFWEWDFGDGGVSTLQNPTHVYTSAGLKTVSLKATNLYSEDTVVKTNFISVTARTPSITFFGLNPRDLNSGETTLVSFSAVGLLPSTNYTPTLYGDPFQAGASILATLPVVFTNVNGEVSASNVSAVFNRSSFNGSVIIRLTDGAGNTYFSADLPVHITSILPATPNFNISLIKLAGRTEAQFADTSAGVVDSYFWDFGDSSNSTTRNPLHVYTSLGRKSLLLRVTNPGGSADLNRTDYFNVQNNYIGENPYWSNVITSIRGDNSLINDATYTLPTVLGSATITDNPSVSGNTDFISPGGGGALYFDGSQGSAVKIPITYLDHPLNFKGNDFTIRFNYYHYPDNFQGGYVFCLGGGYYYSWAELSLQSFTSAGAGKLQIAIRSEGTDGGTPPDIAYFEQISGLPSNQWCEIQVSRQGSVFRVHIDKTLAWTKTDARPVRATNNLAGLGIGGSGWSDNNLPKECIRAAIDNFKIINGVYVDPNIDINNDYLESNVLLKLRFENSDNATSGNINEVQNSTGIAYLGQARASVTQKRSGGSSAYFASSPSWIGTGDGAVFDTGDFCIEFSIYPSDTGSTRALIANRVTDTNGWYIKRNSSGYVSYENKVLGVVRSVTSNVISPSNAWTDILIERANGVVYFYQNDTLITTSADTSNMESTGNGVILGWQHTGAGDPPYYGYMDNFRITKAARKKNSQLPVVDFTIAGSASGQFPFSVNFINQATNANSYLWDFGDGSTSTAANPTHIYTSAAQCNVTLTIDTYFGVRTITKIGYITVHVTAPLTNFVKANLPLDTQAVETKGHTVSLVGNNTFTDGKLNLTGNNSVVVMGASSEFTIGANESFSFECFVTPSQLNTYYQILASTSNNGSATGGFFLEYSTLRGIIFTSDIGGIGYNTAIPFDNVEHHLVVGRLATGSMYIGIDGVIKAIATYGGAFNTSNSALSVGNLLNYSEGGFIGKLRGVRYTVGVDRGYYGAVNSNYTVPSLPLLVD